MVNIQFSEHSLKQRLAKILTVPKWTKQPIVTAKAFLQSLTIAQRCYLLALIALLLFQSDIWLAAIITAVALIIEFWPKFAIAWHSLAGKAIFLLFYAVIANFALAASGSVVNEITGVSASHLSYTHNFAILLYLPIWFVCISILALLLLQIVIPCYLLFHIGLRILGLETNQQDNKKRFVVTTAFLRMVLSVVLLMNLVAISDGETLLENVANKIQKNEKVSLANTVVEVKITEKAQTEAEKAANDLTMQSADGTIESLRTFGHTYYKGIRELIALFAYKFEANGRSRCEKLANSVVVELNDYEILEITESANEKYGYHFEVKKCISPAFGQIASPPK